MFRPGEPWYEQTKQCLRELADSDFQNRVWVCGEGPEISSFSEVISQLYDDTGLGDYLRAKTPVFGDEIDSVLAELDVVLDDIDGQQDAAAIIGDAKWQRVQELAHEALSKIEDCERRYVSGL